MNKNINFEFDFDGLVHANLGDTVICINNEGSYTTYDDFFRAYKLNTLLERYCYESLVVGEEYKVVGFNVPEDSDCKVYILKDMDNKIYLCTDNVDYLYVSKRGE